MKGDLHYFHPQEADSAQCAKCGMGEHEEALPTGPLAYVGHVGSARPDRCRQIVTAGMWKGYNCTSKAGHDDHCRLDLPPGRIEPLHDGPPPTEQAALLAVFVMLLREVTADGGRKRAAGTKPPWWRDPSHECAIWSHMNRWKHGEQHDPDSGAHPLVHLAWRALSIAYQETYGMVDPAQKQPPVADATGEP